MSTRTDLAWLAGIIDGEGSVALSHGGNRAPHLRLMIYSGDHSIIDKVRGIMVEHGIPAVCEKWDRRAARPNLMFLIGTSGVMKLYPLVRPFLVRQVEQLDAGHAFMAAAYRPGAQRVRWSDEQRAAWEVLRGRFHNLAA
jgi:hypothetical protein